MNRRYTIKDAQHKFSKEQQRVDNIKLYVVQSLSADLHANAVASKFNISISSLQHLFTQYEHKAFHQFVEDARMARACELLQVTGARIKEVMYAAGYRNRKTFRNAFKKKFGNPPSYFQK
jgi:AraC-like DNA-binding protein